MSDATLTDAELVAAFDQQLSTLTDLHTLDNVLDVPYTLPNNTAHKGYACALRSVRNMGLSRNRTVARMRAVVVVTLAWRLTADQKSNRTDMMAAAASIQAAITDLAFQPTGSEDPDDQIRYVGADYMYHPAASGWYLAVLTFETDYDTVLSS